MTGRVGYVLLEFPRYSETFILNEIAALREFGIPARIFCLRGTKGAEWAIPEEFRDITEVFSSDVEEASVSIREIVELLEERPAEVAGVIGTAYSKFLRLRESGKGSQRVPFWKALSAVRISVSCRLHSIDHLHCHYATDPLEVGLVASRFAGISCSFTGHAKDIFTMQPADLGDRVRRSAFAVACSRTGADWMVKAAPECTDKIHCVYHGIRLDDWQMERRSAADPPLLLAVGRLTPKKGFHVLVEAVGLLRERGVDVNVDIIGEGRKREDLERKIEELGLGDRVRLHGRKPQEAIRERFAVASALVLPSVILESNNQDGVANVVIEAMAAGLPVIVSEIPALLEIVEDGKTGLTFPAGDPAALAQRIEHLLSEPAIQSSLSAAGRERVAGFDTRTAAQNLARLFEFPD